MGGGVRNVCGCGKGGVMVRSGGGGVMVKCVCVCVCVGGGGDSEEWGWGGGRRYWSGILCSAQNGRLMLQALLSLSSRSLVH